ncbi:hypothetical protein D3C80_1815850 [compost metagenome]
MILGVDQDQRDRDLALPFIRLDQPGLHPVGRIGCLGSLAQQVIGLRKLAGPGLAQRLETEAAAHAGIDDKTHDGLFQIEHTHSLVMGAGPGAGALYRGQVTE